MARGKRYREAAAKIDPDQEYAPQAAVALARETSVSKFDSTIEAHIRLGVDPRHAEQMVRGTVVLPHGTGKKQRILVFAQGEKMREATEAGADFLRGGGPAQKDKQRRVGVQRALATPRQIVGAQPPANVLCPPPP